ncbi:MAG: phage portal protein [Saprospiraceae bacterium]|nr:phage portal protein [Saprospiraceae bacterium]
MVTPDVAHKFNALYACVNLITETKTLVGAKIYRSTLTGKELVYKHDQVKLLTRNVNDYQSFTEWEKQWVASYLIWGSGYAEIIRNPVGRPIEYHNLNAWDVTPKIVKRKRVYIIQEEGQKERIIQADDMLHLCDISYNGEAGGTSRISSNADALKEYGSIQNYSREMYENGVYMSGYIYGDATLTPEVGEKLRSTFEGKFSSKSGGVGILPKGFKYEPMKYNLPMADAQMIAAKNSTIEDIARMFRVPLTLIQRGEYADNKGDNEYNTYLAVVIAPLCILIESEFNRKLFRPSEIRQNYYVKFELKGLERTNMKDRYEAHRIAINAGFMNADEVRQVEGMNPTDDGSGAEYMKPLNSIPGTMWNKDFDHLMKEKNGTT